MKTAILGIGSYAPPQVLTNADLEKMVDTTDEWITTRTGIKERRIADKDTPSSELAIIAAREALEMAGITADQLDAIVVGTVTPDYYFPSTACLLQHKLGARKIMALDISAGCTGFIYATILGDTLIQSGRAKYVLVVGVEELTKITNWTDRSSCILFGDGAGAVVLGAPENDEQGILSTYAAADGSLGDLLYQPGGGSVKPASHETVDKIEHTIKMAGNEVFKHAVRQMEEAAIKALEKANVAQDKLDWLITHQANMRIIDFLARRLKMPMEQVIVTIDKYGNTSAASVPMAFGDAVKEGKIKRGDLVLLVAFGAGFTWGSVLFRF